MNKTVDKNVSYYAYSEIKRLILLQEFKPGQRLPEVALSKEIGVSRTPIREALRKLASEGWVSMVQNSGAWVASPTRGEMLDAYELRGKLETWAIQKAMPNITPLLIRKLEDNVEQEALIYKEKRSLAYPDVNNHFHMLIAEAGGNEALCYHLKIALSKTLVYMALYEPYFDFENNCSLREHMEILETLKEKNEAEAVKRMQAHIDKGFIDLRLD